MLLQLQALALGQVVSQNKISTTLYISHNTITAQIFTQLRPKICKMPATAELLLQQMHCRSDFKPNSNSQQKKPTIDHLPCYTDVYNTFIWT